MKRRTYLALFLTLMLIEGIVVFNATIFSNSANAEVFEAEQGLSFTLNSSVAVSITGGTGSGSDGLTIEDLVPGDYKDSNIITVTASSNSASGYTLSSSVGSSTYASTELRRNGTETANKFTSLTANKASLSNFDPGYWGYSYSTNGGTSWISGDIVSGTSSGYNGLPLYTTTTPIKLINSSSASSSSIKFKIGAKATSSQVSGAYTNIINFIGVGKVITTNYAVTFNDPSGEASGMPSQQTGTTDSGAVQLPSTVPTRPNYIFKGWCTTSTTDDTCSGNTIQPSGFLALNAGTSPSDPEERTLYAMWKSTKTFMQDATLADCGQTMYDKRDSGTGTAYTTALIGSQCWMTTNLNLAGDTALSADDTDVTSAYISSFTTSNNLTKNGDTIVLPASTTSSGFDTNKNNYSYVANSDNASSNCSSAPGCYSYYSWDAATLGSGRTLETDNTNAEQSICPKGWHLPSTYNGNPNDSTDFRKLMIALGGSSSIQTYNSSTTPTGATMSSALQASPNNFLFAGNYGDGAFHSGGSSGNCWSSTSGSNNWYAKSLTFNSSNNVSSASNFYRNDGRSVRCVMDKTMQDVGSWESQVGAGGESTAVDKRDGAEYTIARLADGNLWMTQNLRFQGTDLKVGESDVTSDITMTYGQLTSGNSYTEPRIATGSTTDYGTYYNFCAASAGEVCNDTTQQDATRSVCPAGWKLPTQAQLNAVPKKDSHFTVSSGLAGYYYDGSLDADTAGWSGNWWASTARSATYQYDLNYDRGLDDWTVYGMDKYSGQSVRCVRAS